MKIIRHPSKPLIWWHSRRGSIDMNPPYQRRGRLWSSSDKAYLIDSIINGFDIPKLYMADFQLADSKLNINKLPYAIIDGKQRFEAIFDFFDEKLNLNEDFIWRQDSNCRLGGMNLTELRIYYPKIAEQFETETIDIVSVISENENEINELFVRLNRSKPLTGAEVRKAMVGAIPDLIRQISSHDFFKENANFRQERGGEFNAAAKLLLFEYHEKPVSTKKKDLDMFAGETTITGDKVELIGHRATEGLSLMQQIFLPKDDLLSSEGSIPVYYWFVKNAPDSQRQMIRDFLNEFDRVRRSFAREREALMNAELLQVFLKFSHLNRSINDGSSHSGRMEILCEEFDKWRKDQIRYRRIAPEAFPSRGTDQNLF